MYNHLMVKWFCVCSRECWACGGVLERLRRDQSQPSSFKLIISFTVSPSFRRRRCCVPGRTSRFKTLSDRRPLCWCLHLVFSFYSRARESAREAQERIGARCDRWMNGWMDGRFGMWCRSRCVHSFILVLLPSMSLVARVLLRFSTVMSLVVTAKAVTHKFVIAQWWKISFVCLAIIQSLRNNLWITECCRSFSSSAVIFRSFLPSPRTSDRVCDRGGRVFVSLPPVCQRLVL